MVDADSSEQQSVKQEYESLDTPLPWMSKGEDLTRATQARARERAKEALLYITVMEADSNEQQSSIQLYKDLATLPLMGRGEKQSITLDPEKKESLATAQVWDSQPMNDQSVVNTDKQTSHDAGLNPVAMGECFNEYSSIKGIGQNMQCKMQDAEKSSNPMTECFSPVLACNSADCYLAGCDQKLEPVLDIDPRSCQSKCSTKTMKECYPITPRETFIADPEKNYSDVSRENCHNSVDKCARISTWIIVILFTGLGTEMF